MKKLGTNSFLTYRRIKNIAIVGQTLAVGLIVANLQAGDSPRLNHRLYIVNEYNTPATVELDGPHSKSTIQVVPGVKLLPLEEGEYIATVSQPKYETFWFRIEPESPGRSSSSSIKILNLGKLATLVVKDDRGKVISYYWDSSDLFTNIARAFGAPLSPLDQSDTLSVDVFKGNSVEVFEYLRKTNDLNWPMTFAEVRMVPQPAGRSLLEAYVKTPQEPDHVGRALEFLCYHRYDPKTGKEWQQACESLCAGLTADASIWKEPPVLRQLGIEAALTKKDYVDWKPTHIDRWPFAVLQSTRFGGGIVQSSLMTVDTKSKGWFDFVLSHISELERFKRVQDKVSVMRLDLRLQPGGSVGSRSELQKLREVAAASGIELVDSDFP